MAKKNDLVVRLLLENASFQGNIRESTKEVQRFKQQIEKGTDILDNLTGGLVKSATKYASWGAAAAAAGKLVSDAYMSSEQAADEWRRIQSQCTEAYSFFVKTLESGSWTNFFSNLESAIKGAAELYDKLDRLGSIKTNNSAAIAVIKNSIAEANRKLADKSISDEVRKQLKAQIKANEQRLRSMMGEEVEAGKQAGFAQIKQSLSGYGLTDKQMKEATYQLINRGQAYYDEMDKVIAEWQKSGNRAAVNMSGNWGATTYMGGESTMPDSVKIAYAVKQGESDANRLAGMATYVEAINYATQAEREARTALRQAYKGDGSTSTAKGGSATLKDNIEVGSLTYINNMISNLTRQRDATIDTAKQAAIDEQIAAYVRQRIDIMLQRSGTSVQEVGAISGGVGNIDFATPNFDDMAVSQGVQSIIAYNASLEAMKQDFADGVLVGAVDDISSAFRSLGACVDSTAGQVVNFAIQAAKSIADVIALNATLMASNQAAALAGGAKNAFQLPFPFNLAMYASTAAAIFSIFASLPKFADGGIVAGISSGDRNLIRVNGGEMVLNTAQQQRLFAVLNGRDNGRATNVRFVIDGDALAGVYDNYNRKRGALL